MEKKLKHWLETFDDKENPDEFDAKQLVKLYSIKVPKGKRLGPEDELNIDDIKPPYVVKVCSSTILHKTEFKGVLLNNDKECVQDNFKLMQDRFPKENILVENQSTYMGPEFIIGIIKDPALGHAVMVGAGGVLTEIYKDTAFRLAPCSVTDATDMIDELVLSPVLAQTISQVSRLAHDLGDKLSQLDINPIVFSDGEWIALDVKVMFE